MDTEELKRKVQAIPYWYHRIELPGGIVTPGWAPINPKRYYIPDDLTGKRVLDIGAWDGYWTWEALKRGAKEVVAIDDFSDDCGNPKVVKRNKWETFDLCREAFGFNEELGPKPSEDGWWNPATNQRVFRLKNSVYDLEEIVLGRFDIVFFFGTIYHLKHPLLALEAISKVCNGSLYIETASLDEYSPYRGGVKHGYIENDMVMEFYPGNQYGSNAANWWTPTLQCLGAMMASVGFKDIECWPLTEEPKSLVQCRGFASGTKDPEKEPAYHPPEVEKLISPVALKVAAVMSVPRLGFQDNMTCAIGALAPLHIPLINTQGAYWGQILERGMEQIIDAGYDTLITIDYDTVFTTKDVRELLRLYHMHPEASAIVPIQTGRIENKPILMSMKTISGNIRNEVPLDTIRANEIMPIVTGHFGLTILRVKDLLEIPKPWLWDQPNADNRWGPGKIDADIYFWKQLEKAGKTALLATHVVVGHLELLVGWPDKNMQIVYQMPTEFHDKGKPKEVWQ